VTALRRREAAPPKRAPLSPGDEVLVAYVAMLLCFYVFAFGAPHFLGRYLAPSIVLTVPLVAVWLARHARIALATLALGIALNAPYFVRSLRGTPARESRFWTEQTALTLARIAPSCIVGAGQSGTLSYFRDGVINLDGKVNPAALDARARRALPGFVRASAIDVVVDWPIYADDALGEGHAGFHRSANFGEEFEVWVRDGRGGCLDAR
jgi:hypothetical protein